VYNKKQKQEYYRQTRRTTILKNRYGITEDDYDVMFKEQDGLCAICKQPSTHKNLDVDHNHETNKVRGLLCNNCNRGLGHLQDSVLVLESAINYLKRDISGKGGSCGV
jgi:hypothetical protein